MLRTAPGKPSMMHRQLVTPKAWRINSTTNHLPLSSSPNAMSAQSFVNPSPHLPMVIPRLSKYLPREINFKFASLTSAKPDVPPKPALNKPSSSQSRRFSETSGDMATLLWGYLRIPFIFASGLGMVVSSGLFYYQKYVF